MCTRSYSNTHMKYMSKGNKWSPRSVYPQLRRALVDVVFLHQADYAIEDKN